MRVQDEGLALLLERWEGTGPNAAKRDAASWGMGQLGMGGPGSRLWLSLDLKLSQGLCWLLLMLDGASPFEEQEQAVSMEPTLLERQVGG